MLGALTVLGCLFGVLRAELVDTDYRGEYMSVPGDQASCGGCYGFAEVCFTVFHCVFLCFTVFYWVSLCFTEFYCVSLYFTVFHCISLYFTVFHCVSL